MSIPRRYGTADRQRSLIAAEDARSGAEITRLILSSGLEAGKYADHLGAAIASVLDDDPQVPPIDAR